MQKYPYLTKIRRSENTLTPPPQPPPLAGEEKGGGRLILIQTRFTFRRSWILAKYIGVGISPGCSSSGRHVLILPPLDPHRLCRLPQMRIIWGKQEGG